MGDPMNVKDLIFNHEGLRLHPYKDTQGYLTVGIGRNLEGNGISVAEAEFLLDNDIKNCEQQLRDKFPWYDDLDEVRKAVILDMCFEFGIKKLLTFTGTLGFIRDKKWKEAANAMRLSLWHRLVPNRCNEDALMMETGQWPKVK